MAETINVPLLGPEKKSTVMWGGAVLALVVVYALYKKGSAATQSATQTSSGQIVGDGGASYGDSGYGSGYFGANGGGGGAALPPSSPTGASSSPTPTPPQATTTPAGPALGTFTNPIQVQSNQFPVQADPNQIFALGQITGPGGQYTGLNVAGGAPTYADVNGVFKQGFNPAALPAGTEIGTLSQFQGQTGGYQSEKL